jgi:hypothetical protein
MRRLLIASVLSVGAIAGAMAVPTAAQAHWRHAHWHHAWYRGPSYYPFYAYSDEWRYWPNCVWHRDWDAYWFRACF